MKTHHISLKHFFFASISAFWAARYFPTEIEVTAPTDVYVDCPETVLENTPFECLYYVTSGTGMTSAEIKVGSDSEDTESGVASVTSTSTYSASKSLSLVPGIKIHLKIISYFSFLKQTLNCPFYPNCLLSQTTIFFNYSLCQLPSQLNQARI